MPRPLTAYMVSNMVSSMCCMRGETCRSDIDFEIIEFSMPWENCYHTPCGCDLVHRMHYPRSTQCNMTFDLMGGIVRSTSRIAETFIYRTRICYDLEGKIPVHLPMSWPKRLFQCVVKFILDVYDLDDLMHIDDDSGSQKLGEEYDGLYQKLFSETKVAHHNLAVSIHDAVKFIASGVEPLQGFHRLREHDVGDVLRQYLMYRQPRVYPAKVTSKFSEELWPGLFSSSLSKLHRKWTRSVMKSYVPLKEKYKVCLNLELMRNRCFNVVEVLYWDFIINVRELSKHLEDPHYFAILMEGLARCLFGNKQKLLRHFETGTLFPLLCGIFLPCESDVIEVVRIANHERMMQGHRFISLRHILFSLSMTKFADHIEKLSNYMTASEEIAKKPIYKVYEAANRIALESKARETEAVECDGKKILRVEHLVQAVTDEIRATSLSQTVPRFDLRLYSEGSNQLQRPTESEVLIFGCPLHHMRKIKSVAKKPIYKVHNAVNCIAPESKSRETEAVECDDKKILRVEHSVQAGTDELRTTYLSQTVPRFELQLYSEGSNQLQPLTESEVLIFGRPVYHLREMKSIAKKPIYEVYEAANRIALESKACETEAVECDDK